MRTLTRVAVTATFLHLGFVLGVFALADPAFPQGGAANGDTLSQSVRRLEDGVGEMQKGVERLKRRTERLRGSTQRLKDSLDRLEDAVEERERAQHLQPINDRRAAAKGDLDTPKASPRPCPVPFEAFVDVPGWRILEGDKLQAYLETAFTEPPSGDKLAYTVHRDRVVLVLSRNGCVVGRQIVKAKTHRKVIEMALGVVV